MHINMKKEKKYIEYILKQAEALLAIDSPSGFTEKVTDYLCEEYKRLGYKPVKTKKGGVLVEIGGKGNAVLTMAHVDTLGGMVAEIKINGRLRLTKVGGLNANNIEGLYLPFSRDPIVCRETSRAAASSSVSAPCSSITARTFSLCSSRLRR